MRTIAVLLSSYNGSRYILEQLDSLYSQKNVSIYIYVRDDSSTDQTVEVLNANNAGKFHLIKGNNLGWAKSFISLLCDVPDYDYYAFCDQDDVWLPDKLNVAINYLEKMGDSPNLYFSNLTYWKDGIEYGKVKPDNLYFDQYTCLIQCPAYGCTMVFNNKLAQVIKKNPPKVVFAHDFWVFQTAMLLGHVVYDPKSYILYRQHANNQIGAKRSAKEIWGRRIKKSIPRLFTHHEAEDTAKELLRCYDGYLRPEQKEIVQVVAYYRSSIRYYLTLLFSNKYVMSSRLNTFFLKCKILLCKL